MHRKSGFKEKNLFLTVLLTTTVCRTPFCMVLISLDMLPR